MPTSVTINSVQFSSIVFLVSGSTYTLKGHYFSGNLTSGTFVAVGLMKTVTYTFTTSETAASAYQHLLDAANTAEGLSLTGSTSNGSDTPLAPSN